MSKCRQRKQKTTSEKSKFDSKKKLGLEWTKNGLEKPHRKKIRSKKLQKNKNQSEKIASCEQKYPLARKRIFVQKPISQSTIKLEQKNVTPQSHSLFRSISCFGVTKITTPVWLHKSWKYVSRSEKRQRPNTIQTLRIVKKRRVPKKRRLRGWRRLLKTKPEQPIKIVYITMHYPPQALFLFRHHFDCG